jgi:hypothetical protein
VYEVKARLLLFLDDIHSCLLRCPIECRLARSDSPWQCIVSLRRITGPDGQLLGQARNEQFGKVIFNKANVEDRIRRAQLAILNPDKLSEYFLECDPERHGQNAKFSFSQSCVTLQISGPDVADLSFCDLPGGFKTIIHFPLYF